MKLIKKMIFKNSNDFSNLLIWILTYRICLSFFETKNLTAIICAFIICYILKWICLLIISTYKK